MGVWEPPPQHPALRPDALARLSGAEQLVVVFAPRFLGASTLLRDWVGTAAPAGAVVAHVIDPARTMSEGEYWSTLAASIPRPAGCPSAASPSAAPPPTPRRRPPA